MGWSIKRNDKSSKQDPIRANRAVLLEAIDQTWLSGLLDHLLNQQESLKIGLEALEPDKLKQSMGGEAYLLKDNLAVLQTFKDFGQKLILLGEPGAGKTVLMLQLAKLLWNAAKRDERNRIPMIFPLASWVAKQLPLEEWLQNELHNRYGASEKMAKALVESEQIIFLLDGLDEVAVDYREDCLKAIKEFVENPDRHVEYVLCSRRTEFEALQTRLDISGEIVLQPLTMEQIRGYLKKETFAALRGLLDTNDIVRNQFATIPFMLNTMAYVTRGESDDGLRRLVVGKDSIESLRAAFLEEYVTQRLAEKPNEKYSNANIRHWLRWLAEQLIKHDETDFYLEDMQPNWLINPQQKLKLWIGVGLMGGVGGGIVVGLAVGLVVGLVGGSEVGVRYGLGIGLGFGLGFGLVVALRSFSTTKVDMTDRLRWTFGPLQVTVGLVVGVVFGLGLGPVSGLVLGMGIGLATGLNSQSMLRYRIRPGQGIQRSLWNGLFVILVFGVGVGLAGGLIGGLRSGIMSELVNILRLEVGGLVRGLVVGLLGGLIIGLVGGPKAFFQHYVLRWMLALEGNLPFWRYDKFLDYANDLVILRKVGGGYRFTHDMLRQHLAGASAPKAESQQRIVL